MGEHYTVVERIGRGVMGVVYKAHDSVLDRHGAIKRRRFGQEARAAARLTIATS